jgi:hypothetical protein
VALEELLKGLGIDLEGLVCANLAIDDPGDFRRDVFRRLPMALEPRLEELDLAADLDVQFRAAWSLRTAFLPANPTRPSSAPFVHSFSRRPQALHCNPQKLKGKTPWRYKSGTKSVENRYKFDIYPRIT